MEVLPQSVSQSPRASAPISIGLTGYINEESNRQECFNFSSFLPAFGRIVGREG